MSNNKRKIPNFKDKNLSNNLFKTFINLSKEKSKLKFNALLNKANSTSISKNNSSNNFDSNILSESRAYSEISSIYNYIINRMDSLIKNINKYNYEYVFLCLIKIKDAINLIFSNNIILKRNNSNISPLKLNKESMFKYNDFNSKEKNLNKRSILLDDKGQEINSFSNKINSNMNETSSEIYINNTSKRIKLLRQKNSDLEEQIKIEKLKYLFCIGEQHKKIKKLEEELNKKNVDNMPKNEIKKIRCFPYYKKYDFLDKCVLKTKDEKNLSSNNKKRHKKFFVSQYENFDNYENEDKIDNINEKELIENTKNIIECGEKVLYKKEMEGNKLLDREGNYLVSHPKLKYIKDELNMKSWKTNELLDSFPKQFLRHKFGSKSQKNSLIDFPSSLNQIIVNLEKLRIHNNFKRIENDFKENRKNK
jgi:hypothetical protein